MTSRFRVLREKDYADSFGELDQFALDVLVGFSAARKNLPSKYFYDDRGTELYQKITGLDEYYLTSCELEIIRENATRIGAGRGEEPFNLVELGAGFSEKTLSLLDAFVRLDLDFQYVPIDISESAMRALDRSLGETLPTVSFHGLVTDYFNGLKWLNNRFRRRNLVLFLGSSIGNFTSGQSRVFLRNLWNCLNHDDIVIIGFDLKKDIEVLLRAYNDSRRVTSEFNLNLLHRINRELDGQFDVSKFRHFGTYDVFSGAMESYLVSLERQSVFIGKIGISFAFEPWEPIHTEYSYKYLISDIEKLASETGFEIIEFLFDARRFFTDSVLRVYKPASLVTREPLQRLS